MADQTGDGGMQVPAPPPDQSPPDDSTAPPWYKRWWAIAGFVFVGLLFLGAVLPEVDQDTVVLEETEETASPTPSPTPSPRPTESPSPTPTPTAEPAREAPEGVPAEAQAAVVERIVDGDTIWVRVDEPGGPLPAGASHNLRILQIDTPETKHPDKPVECWGPEAAAFTEAQLPVGSTVYLVADEEDTDRYGRFLRYVWTEDGTFFNVEAARQGMARAVLYEPNDRHIEDVRAAEAEAKKADRGMWGPPCDYDAAPPPPPPPPPPPDPEPDTAPAPQPGTPYPNCTAAREAGGAPVHRGEPGYGPHLDRDGDGVGCE